MSKLRATLGSISVLVCLAGPASGTAGSAVEWGVGRVQVVPMQAAPLSPARVDLVGHIVVPTQVPVAPTTREAFDLQSAPIARVNDPRGKTVEATNASHTLLQGTDNNTRIATQGYVAYKKVPAPVALPKLAPVKTLVLAPAALDRVQIEYVADAHRQEAPGFWMKRPLPATEAGPAPNAWAATRN